MANKSTSWRSGTALSALILASFGTGQAHAQSIALPSPVEVKMEDENGVEVVAGVARFSVQDVSMGPISHSRSSFGRPGGHMVGIPPTGAMVDSNDLGIGLVVPQNVTSRDYDYRSKFIVNVGGASDTFRINADGTLEADNGGSLDHGTDSVVNYNCSSTNIWTFTSSNGVVAKIDMGKYGGGDGTGAPGSCGRVTEVTSPDGLVTRYTYDVPNAAPNGSGPARLKSVNRNDGFQLKYRWSGWTLLGVTALNNGYEVCDPQAESCTPTASWPSSAYAWNSPSIFAVTDQAGGITRYTLDRHHRVVAVKPPSATVDITTYQYCGRAAYWDPWSIDPAGTFVAPDANDAATMCAVYHNAGPADEGVKFTQTEDRIMVVNHGGEVWNYSYPAAVYQPYYYKYAGSNQEGYQMTAMVSSLGTGPLIYFGSDWLNADYEVSARNRMLHAWKPGSPSKTFTYDARGNITSDGVLTAGFDITCSNIKTCNKANWVRDTAGNQTDITYDPVHGGVLTVTGPAVQVNGSGPLIRPQTRYSYVQRYAWFKNASGAMTRSTEPIWKLASESSCRTSAASGSGCAVAGDEVVKTYDYGPDSGPNNLLLRGVAVTADGVTMRTCYGYDRFGNKISETAPRANLTSCP